MNARRKPRIFADHKPPLVAFVLVAFTTMMLLVHVARSDAAPTWLRQGVAGVVAGGAPLGQKVVSSTLLERAPAVRTVEPPVMGSEAPTTDRSGGAASTDAGRPPQHHSSLTGSGSTHGHHAATPASPTPEAPSGSSEPTEAPDRSESPAGSPSESPAQSSHGYGPRGDGYTPPGLSAEHGHGNGYGHDEQGGDESDDPSDDPSDDQGDDDSDQSDGEAPTRGDGASEDGQHPWWDGDDSWPGHGHGHGSHGSHGHGHHGHGHHGHGHGHGHGHRGHGHP